MKKKKEKKRKQGTLFNDTTVKDILLFQCFLADQMMQTNLLLFGISSVMRFLIDYPTILCDLFFNEPKQCKLQTGATATVSTFATVVGQPNTPKKKE